MTHVRKLTILGLLLATFGVPAYAQDAGLEDRFATLALENATAYLMPITEGLGHALSAGFVETAHAHKVFGFDIGLRAMAALPPASASTFQPVLPSSVTYQGFTFTNPYGTGNDLRTPTAVGAGEGVVLSPQGDYLQAIQLAGEDPANYEIALPDGLDLPAVPFAVAQLSVGLPFATEITFRMIPSVTPQKDIGTIKATGFGGKHTITSWLNATPIDVALFGGVQSFQVGDWLDARAVTYGLIASRSLGPLTLFGQVRRASADVDVGYTVENPDNNPALPAHGTRLGFNTTVDTNTGFGGGLTLRLFGFAVTGEYTHGPYPSASVKAGFSLR